MAGDRTQGCAGEAEHGGRSPTAVALREGGVRSNTEPATIISLAVSNYKMVSLPLFSFFFLLTLIEWPKKSQLLIFLMNNRQFGWTFFSLLKNVGLEIVPLFWGWALSARFVGGAGTDPTIFSRKGECQRWGNLLTGTERGGVGLKDMGCLCPGSRLRLFLLLPGSRLRLFLLLPGLRPNTLLQARRGFFLHPRASSVRGRVRDFTLS